MQEVSPAGGNRVPQSTYPGLFPSKRAYRLRTWLVLLVIACVLPLLLFTSVLLFRSAAAEVEAVEQQVRDRAHLLAEDLDREVSRVLAAAEVLATSETLADGNLAGFYRHAVQVRDLLGTNVVVRDLSRQQVVNTRVPWGTALPTSTAFEADRRAIETGRPQVSGLVLGGVTRSPLLIAVVPVSRGGQVGNLVSLTIPPERLQAILSPERLPPDWVASVADRDGTLIAHSQTREQLIGTRIPTAHWDDIKDARAGVRRVANPDGDVVIQAFSREPISNWVVEVSVPERVVAAPSRQNLVWFTTGGLLIFLIGLGVARAVGRRLVRAILQLAQAIKALGAGRQVFAPAQGIAEIDAVGGVLQEAADLIQKRTAALLESERQLRNVVEGAPFPVMVHAEDGEIVHLSQAWVAMTGYAREELRTVAQWTERAYGERQAAVMSDIRQLYALDRPVDEGEYTICTVNGQMRCWAFRSAPIGHDARGRRLVVSMAADLTERKEAETRLHLLMREVDHRAKNVLAVVLSIVRLSRAKDSGDFVEAVQGRVAAMARAHTLLASARWSGADLGSMVRQELEAHTAAERVSISGLSVAIVANAVQAVCIVLHELATNAAKYGALSTPEGQLAVSWSVDAAAGTLILEWTESGGPPVTPPQRSGFGTLVTERTVRDQLSGELVNTWDRAGLRCRIVLPHDCFLTSGVQASAPTATRKPVNDASKPHPRPGTCVLVVEDEAMTAAAMKEVLQEAGYQVLGPVGRVQDAIDLARTTRPDGAVLDVNLFGQVSFPVAAALNAMGIPFLFYTGYDCPKREEEYLKQALVLMKPVSPDQLKDGVATLLAAGTRTASIL